MYGVVKDKWIFTPRSLLLDCNVKEGRKEEGLSLLETKLVYIYIYSRGELIGVVIRVLCRHALLVRRLDVSPPPRRAYNAFN